MYTTHCADSVITAHKVGVGNGSIAGLYRPHWLTGKDERLGVKTDILNWRPLPTLRIGNGRHNLGMYMYLSAPTVADGLKTISAPLRP